MNTLDFFSDLDQKQEPVQNTGADFFSDLETPKESLYQNIASSVPVQAGLGLAKSATYGLDLLKSFGHAELLQELEDLEERGIPVDREKYLKGMQEALSVFPTQELLEKGFEKVTGINLEPKTETQKFVRTAGEYINPKKLLETGLKGAVKTLGAGIAGAGVEKGLEEAGVPSALAVLPAALTTGKIQAPKHVKKLSPELKLLEDIAEKHELRKFSGIFKEGAPISKPIVAEKAAEKARKELADTSKKAIDNIIEKNIPIASAQKKGYNLDDLSTRAYEYSRQKAKNIKQEIDMSPFSEWADKKINQVKQSAPSLGPNQKKIIELLEEEKSIFSNKKISAEQLIDQYHNYNERVRGIYRKPEFSGFEEKVKNIHGEFNKELLSIAEKTGNKDIAKAFRFANEVYSQKEKLGKMYKILEPGLNDPKKLKGIINSKKSEFIKRDLGKEAFNDIKDISNYAQKAEEKIFDQIKIKPNFISNMKDWGKVISYLSLGWEGLATGGALEGISRLRGQLLLRDSSRKSYKKLLQAISSGSESAIKRYSGELDKSVENDYGSIDDFLEGI